MIIKPLSFLPILPSLLTLFFLLLLNFSVHAQPPVEVKAEMVWQGGGNPDYTLGLQPALGGDLFATKPALVNLNTDGDIDLLLGDW